MTMLAFVLTLALAAVVGIALFGEDAATWLKERLS
jgi:hypothetical protein